MYLKPGEVFLYFSVRVSVSLSQRKKAVERVRDGGEEEVNAFVYASCYLFRYNIKFALIPYGPRMHGIFLVRNFLQNISMVMRGPLFSHSKNVEKKENEKKEQTDSAWQNRTKRERERKRETREKSRASRKWEREKRPVVGEWETNYCFRFVSYTGETKRHKHTRAAHTAKSVADLILNGFRFDAIPQNKIVMLIKRIRVEMYIATDECQNRKKNRK